MQMWENNKYVDRNEENNLKKKKEKSMRPKSGSLGRSKKWINLEPEYSEPKER